MQDFSPRPKRLVSIIPEKFIGSVSEELLVTDVQTDSREVSPGSLFIALQGINGDGEKYISNAVENGAVAILVESKHYSSVLNVEIPVIGITELKQHVADIVDIFYDHASNRLLKYGVTGTNGKSTITSLIAQLSSTIGKKAAVIGTLGYGLVDENLIQTDLTTPDVVKFHRIFAELNAASVEVVAVEVSSHGIDQKRVENVSFQVGILSNITRDHLDYHGSFEKYADVKKSFLLSESCQSAVVNLDDPECKKIIDALNEKKNQCLSYGIDNSDADVKALDACYSPLGINAQIISPWGKAKILCPLMGKFNLSNLLAAISAMCIRGVDFEQIVDAVSNLHAVDGRLQVVEMQGAKESPRVFVDYAHTPDALSQVLQALRLHLENRLWVVFGCGGDRDRGKRAEMGAVASRFADRVIVTSDNPRSEDPEAIIREVISGIDANAVVEAVSEREIAISLAVGSCEKNDVILIAGKGHEDYQIIGDQKIPFSDYLVAQNALQQRSNSQRVAQ